IEIDEARSSITRPAERAASRGAGVHRHERREGSGLVLRRYRRGNPQRPDAAQASKGSRANVGVLLQGQARRPSDDRLVEQATTNIEAYQLYLKGRAWLDRRGAS